LEAVKPFSHEFSTFEKSVVKITGAELDTKDKSVAA